MLVDQHGVGASPGSAAAAAETSSQDIRRLLNRTREDYECESGRVSRTLKSWGVQVQLDCEFVGLTEANNGPVNGQINVAHDRVTVTCGATTVAEATGPVVIIDARSKLEWVPYREEMQKLAHWPACSEKPLSVYGNSFTAYGSLPISLLLGATVETKSRSAWGDPHAGTAAQLTTRGQRRLTDMFKSLNGEKLVRTYADKQLWDASHASSHADAIRLMCDELQNISHQANKSCDMFYDSTMHGETAWCNASMSPDCNTSWAPLLDEICPQENCPHEICPRSYHPDLEPVACIAKKNLTTVAQSRKDSLFFLGRNGPNFGFPDEATSAVYLGEQVKMTSYTKGMAYVHVGYTAATSDGDERVAQLYLLQALIDGAFDKIVLDTNNTDSCYLCGLLGYKSSGNQTAADMLRNSFSKRLVGLWNDINKSKSCGEIKSFFIIHPKKGRTTTAVIDREAERCFLEHGRPLIGVDDLLHGRGFNWANKENERPKPTVVNKNLFQWYGYPDFGSLGNVPLFEFAPSSSDWKCTNWSSCESEHDVMTIEVDLYEYVPRQEMRTAQRYVEGWKVDAKDKPFFNFSLTAYVQRMVHGIPCCKLVGVETDLGSYTGLLDMVEPFVDTTCESIREALHNYAVNIGTWREQAVLELMQKVVDQIPPPWPSSSPSQPPSQPSSPSPSPQSSWLASALASASAAIGVNGLVNGGGE